MVKYAYADLAKKWLKVADEIQAVFDARSNTRSPGLHTHRGFF